MKTHKLSAQIHGDTRTLGIPRQIADLLPIDSQSDLYITKTAHGFNVKLYNPEHEDMINIVDDIMKEDHAVLKKLIKWS